MLWLCITFLAIAAIIVVSAMQLAKFGHGLADQTGLGKSLTGMILLAGATSLPEFSVGFHAVSIGAVDLTAGDVLGSSLLNLLIIASLDLLTRKSRRLLSSSSSDHSLSGIVAILMTGLILLGMTIHFPGKFLGNSPLGWATIATYALCVRILYFDQQHFAVSNEEESSHTHFTWRMFISNAPTGRMGARGFGEIGRGKNIVERFEWLFHKLFERILNDALSPYHF